MKTNRSKTPERVRTRKNSERIPDMRPIITVASAILAAAVLLHGAACGAGRERVIVYLLDGTSVEGELIELSAKYVKVDPDGSVSFRAIAADDIERVVLPDSGREYIYPLEEGDIDPDFTKNLEKKEKRRREGLSRVALSFGGGLNIPAGDYYEGLGTGYGADVGMQLRFAQDGPDDSAILFGISYRYGTLGIDDEVFCVYDYLLGDDICVELTECSLHHWVFDLGITTPVTKNRSFAYFTVGISILQHYLTGFAYTSSETFPEETTDDTRAALNFSIGGVLGMTERMGWGIDFGFDFIMENSYNSYYYYDSGPDVAGMVFTMSTGLVVEL